MPKKTRSEVNAPTGGLEEAPVQPTATTPETPQTTTPESTAGSTKKGRGPRTPKKITGSVEGFVNAYGFLHLDMDLMFTLGFKDGEKTPVNIEVVGEGEFRVTRRNVQ